MIFKQITEIFNGDKTQTRRIVKDGEWLAPWDDTTQAILAGDGRLRKLEGRDYAIVPKRGQKQVGRYVITAIRKERLQDITEADALAEGVASVEEYKALWNRINDRPGLRWDDNPEVWVISFRVVEDRREKVL